MKTWFKKLFVLPETEDIQQKRTAQLLYTILLSSLIILGLYSSISFAFTRALFRLGIQLSVALVLIFALLLLRRGKIRLASIVVVSVLWCVFVLAAFLENGIDSPSFSGLVLLILFAGALLGFRFGLIYTIISILAGVLIAFLQMNGLLPSPLYTFSPFTRLGVNAAYFASSLTLLSLATNNLNKALRQAQSELAERRQTEAALRKSEQRYRALFERTNDGIVIMDFDSTIIEINQSGAEMLGYEIPELLGQKGFDLIAADERRAGVQKLEGVVEGQTFPIYERRMLKKDGSEFLVEINLSLVYDENGNPLQSQSVLRDITDRKKTETLLRDIENRYRTLFEGSNDGIFILGLDGLIMEVNQQVSKMLGYTPGEIVGKSASFFAVPDQQTNVDIQLRTLLENGQIPIYERLIRKQDGTLITFEINAGIVYDVYGKPQNIQSVVRDITGRKRVQEELHNLIRQLERQRAKIQTSLDVSKAAISILDPQILMQQTVDLIKTRFEYDYVGLFLLDETCQFAVLRAGTGDPGKKMLATGHKLPIGDGSMIGWSIEHKQPRIAHDVGLDAVHFDNPLLPNTRSEMTLPLIARGAVIGALTVQSEKEAAFYDEDIVVLQVMTDLVAIAIDNAGLHARLTDYAEELEQSVHERTEQLQTTNRELESFSYSVSHDLRAPLRAINGYSSILLEDFASELSPQVRSFQEKIRGSAIRMGNLVDGLLAFSRLGRKKVQKFEIDPHQLVLEVLEELESEIENRHIEVAMGDLPGCEADPLLLKQVYVNLINNAIKFTRNQESARVEIGSRYTERGLTYFVQDNGAGFDMQYADRLFGVFQRLHREEEFEGTGVGLAMIQRIILRHGGEVWAEAEMGKGATFFFTLGGMAIDESGIFF